MKKGVCRDCASAEREESQGEDVFTCHLDPPRGSAGFPRVSGTQWCRQFEPGTAPAATVPTPHPEKVTRPVTVKQTRAKTAKGG